MKKKKDIEKIYVKKPKVGEIYWFMFAGSVIFGTLIRPLDKLTAHYGEPWYMLKGNNGIKYPVSIFKLRSTKPNNSTDV
jgi:hypothetical protein|tara:strand:+ start:61 stop:297 length:237 start_codon:yes stop_codon:yes gene_type:complete